MLIMNVAYKKWSFCMKILGFGKKKLFFVYRFEEIVICFVAYLDVNNMCSQKRIPYLVRC